jgi:hypothetical protein
MWRLADRMAKTAADLTLGTAIVLVHVALARRQRPAAAMPALPAATMDGTRIWRTQISP